MHEPCLHAQLPKGREVGLDQHPDGIPLIKLAKLLPIVPPVIVHVVPGIHVSLRIMTWTSKKSYRDSSTQALTKPSIMVFQES